MDTLEFLDGPTPEPAAAPAPQAEPTPEVASEATGPVRGPDGKFAPKEAAPAPQEAVAAPSPAPQPDAPIPPGHVPLSAMLDIRERAQRAEQELAYYRQQQQHQQPQIEPPDPYEDPAGYDQHVRQQMDAMRWETLTSVSQTMASQQHGADVVTAATQAFMAELQRKPWLNAELRTQAHPYDYVVNWHRREQALSRLNEPSQLDAFLAWQASQGSGAPAQQAAPAAIPQQPKPPPSLASAPAAGGAKPGAVPVGPGVAFDMTFKE